MSKVLKSILLAALVLLVSTDAGAVSQKAPMRLVTAVETGISAEPINSNTTSSSIPMTWNHDVLTQLTLRLAVTWGTTATMNVTCEGSVDDGTSWASIIRCTDATPHVCLARQWQFTAAAGTTEFLLNIQSNYTHLQCTFDDPAAGNGTVTATAVRARQ